MILAFTPLTQHLASAGIAQLGERQTEDLKVRCSIHLHRINWFYVATFFFFFNSSNGIVVRRIFLKPTFQKWYCNSTRVYDAIHAKIRKLGTNQPALRYNLPVTITEKIESIVKDSKEIQCIMKCYRDKPMDHIPFLIDIETSYNNLTRGSMAVAFLHMSNKDRKT